MEELIKLDKNLSEALKKEESPVSEVRQQPIESSAQTADAKAKKEEVRLGRIQELREKLGASSESLERDNAKVVKKIDDSLQEDKENISKPLNRVAENLDELSSIISRNKFPKVRFDIDKLRATVRGENIDSKAISRELGNVSAALNRIRMPEDRRDIMELEPRNFRAVIDTLEELSSKLSLLRKSFEEANSKDIQDIAQEVSGIRVRISLKVEDFNKALILLRKIK